MLFFYKFMKGVVRVKYTIASICIFLLIQGMKATLKYFKTKKVDLKRFFKSGGQISAHTTVISAASMFVGHRFGYNSELFGFALIVSFIVFIDSYNLRKAVGELNNEHKGHSFKESTFGVIVGVAWAIFLIKVGLI